MIRPQLEKLKRRLFNIAYMPDHQEREEALISFWDQHIKELSISIDTDLEMYNTIDKVSYQEHIEKKIFRKMSEFLRCKECSIIKTYDVQISSVKRTEASIFVLKVFE